ncbi:MAG: hypothetical protein AAFR61_27050 [Bacteroidota bacterium]
MKSLHLWAVRRPRPARYIVILLNFVLGFLGFELGLRFLETGQFTGWGIEVGLATGLAIAYLWYPRKLRHYPEEERPKIYRQRVRGNFVLHLLVFGLWVMTGNQTAVWADRPDVPTHQESLLSLQAHLNNASPSPEKIETEKPAKKGFVKRFKDHIRSIKQWRKQLHPAWRIVLTILTLAAAVAVLYLLAALACALVCSELGALAALTVVLGLGLVIFGCILIIRQIWGRPKIFGKNKSQAWLRKIRKARQP